MKSLVVAVISILLVGCQARMSSHRGATASNTTADEDIASSCQDVRDAAAKVLRSSYRLPSSNRWLLVMTNLIAGTSKTNVAEMLRPFNVTVEEEYGSGQGHTVGYRLDDAWLLRCSYRNGDHPRDGTLIRSHLIQRIRHVWVPPPTNFTGVWITYFMNGQKAHEINYNDGRYSGEFIAYYSDGPKAYVQHFDRHGAEGPDTGFYRSGRTNYYGLYKTNKQVGTWTWYNEDGSIQSTRDFSHP